MRHALKRLQELPDCKKTKELLQSLAMLDAVIRPEWERRYFSFNSCWGPHGEAMGSLRNGQGSEFFFLFSDIGCAAKVYDPESPLGRKAKLEKDQVPKTFSAFLNEPAFTINAATCYLWRAESESSWSVAPKAIKEIPFLAFLAGRGEYYRAWAEDYYEVELDQEPTDKVFDHTPLTKTLVHKLNPDASFSLVIEDAKEIGYPYSGK